MSDTENTVVPFRVTKNLLESHVKKPAPPKSKYCRHNHSEMDSLARTVTCTDCGSKLDPFDWMERTLDVQFSPESAKTACSEHFAKNRDA